MLTVGYHFELRPFAITFVLFENLVGLGSKESDGYGNHTAYDTLKDICRVRSKQTLFAQERKRPI